MSKNEHSNIPPVESNTNTLPLSEEYPPEIDDLDEDENTGFAQFVARMEKAYESTYNKNTLLIKLYESGDFDTLNKEIDQIVDNIAAASSEVKENLATLRTLRNFRNPDTEAIDVIIARQKELYSYYRTLVVNEAGLPDEARFTEIESARNAVADKLHEAFPDDTYTAEQALNVLGFVTYDSDNNKSYTFPEDLVPESTVVLWETYMAAVCRHVKLAEDLQSKVINDQQSVVQADRTRTFAHNAITKELHSIINLQPTDKWDYGDTREKLLARIRDQLLPTREAALSDESSQLVQKRQASLDASSQLSSH